MKRGIALGLIATAWAAQAADPRPRTQPTRDVEVIYSIGHGVQQISERARWQGATGRQRIDAPGGHGFMLSDPVADSVAMVSDASRRVIMMVRPHGPLDGGAGRFRRLGTMSVAGTACTEWQVTPEPVIGAVPNRICLTDDGVMLNLRVGDTETARAVSVSYAPIDPGIFALPPDYARSDARSALPPP